LLAVTERQLKDWERHSLVRHIETFSLPDIVALKTLIKLRKDRIPLSRIRLALAALRSRLKDVDDPLRELKVIADGKRIRVEVAGQHMEPLSGQLLFNFDGEELKRLLSFPGKPPPRNDSRPEREAAEHWFQRGLQFEQMGSLQEAVQCYRRATEFDPTSAGAWVNLGTIYFNARQFSRAESHYRRALEADPSYPLAHFNIGNLYDERGDYPRAVEHYLTAIRLNASYADPHYNIALLYQRLGQVMEAVRHWKTYLRLDPGSSWSGIARRELENLRRTTLVRGRTAANRD
jgi:tetratricopeptide (TPR) repeat protein